VALRNKMHPTETRAILESNLEEVNKMQSLTSYLLSLTRYERGDLKLAKEAMSLSDAVQKAIKSVTPLAQKKQITILTHIQSVEIMGNTASIIELATILLDNAIKYSSPEDEIVVSVQKKGQLAILEIEDHGIGIKPSDLPYIFNRFYRSDGSRNKQKVDGYGLGLSIAKSIVELHHSKITVKSTFEKGTTFSVIFSK